MTAPGAPGAPGAPRDADGYRRTPVGGATIRADVIDVYLFRQSAPHEIEFLQLLRAREPLADTWQPVMGHCEPGETSVDCAIRELREEVGLDARAAASAADLLDLWALEQVHPFFIAAINAVVLSPRFAAQVSTRWSPRLNAEHRESRWVRAADLERSFLWPGQHACCREILQHIVPPRSPARDRLRIALPD